MIILSFVYDNNMSNEFMSNELIKIISKYVQHSQKNSIHIVNCSLINLSDTIDV